MKKFLYLIFILAFVLPLDVFAFEDYVVATEGKLNEIRIQYNDVIDVFPLITIMNEKNILIVHPLKIGTTKFSVVKNNKNKFIFDVNVLPDKTIIEPVEGFDIFSIDCPPETFFYKFELDFPPSSDFHTEYEEFPHELKGIN